MVICRTRRAPAPLLFLFALGGGGACRTDLRVDPKETERGADAGADPAAGTRALPPDGPSTFRAVDSAPALPWWRPMPTVTWQWQLMGPLDLSVPATVFDVDVFDATEAQIDELHARGRRIVCYINVGAWEEWRPDRDRFPPEILGRDYAGWSGVRWVDIRRLDLLGPIIGARLDLCRDKGFDAVEPDSMGSAYLNDTGFRITPEDQIAFGRWLAQEAHRRNLGIALKNSSELAVALEQDFDWSFIESCLSKAGDLCDRLSVFTNAGKAVFMVQYVEEEVDWGLACARATALGYSAILKRRNLDAWTERCPTGTP